MCRKEVTEYLLDLCFTRYQVAAQHTEARDSHHHPLQTNVNQDSIFVSFHWARNVCTDFQIQLVFKFSLKQNFF